MSIFDHMSVGVPSIVEGTNFYDGVMAALGLDLLVANDAFAAYGSTAPEFLLMTPLDGKPNTFGNGVHIAFAARTREAVDKFHKMALANFGVDEGAPGPRPGASGAVGRDGRRPARLR